MRRSIWLRRRSGPGGISKVKSARIKAILRAITDTSCPEAGHRVGERSLDWLPRLSVSHAQGYLCRRTRR